MLQSTPANKALLVIDVQQGLFNKTIPIYKADQLLNNINTLIDRAELAGAPIYYVQHSNEKALVKGSQEWRLHSQLRISNTGYFIQKEHGNAFQETSLDTDLKSKQISRLVITGLVTHGCVKATCLGAKELGYDVILVSDGHSSYHRQAAQLIEEWNHNLSEEQVAVMPTELIEF